MLLSRTHGQKSDATGIAGKNERRTQGHRQPFTKVEITSIKVAAEKKAETK